MDYDKESVQGAQSAGVFDSQLDALALGLDEQEKDELRARLQASQDSAADAQKEIEASRERQKRKVSAMKKKNSGLSLWERIVSFFRSLFSGISKENIARKKAVKDSERILLAFSLPIYDPKYVLVRTAFIEILRLVEKKIDQFAEFFNTNFIIGAEDFLLNRKPCFSRFIIESSLSLDQSTLLRQLKNIDLRHSFQVMGEKAAQKELSLLIKKFADSFNKVNTARIEEQLEFYISLLNLRNYNFSALYSLFLREGATEEAPVFRDFSLEHCLGYLKNLDSYLSGIVFSKFREEHYKWFDRFEEEDGIALNDEGGSLSGSDGGFSAGVGGLQYSSEDFKNMISPLRKICEKNIVQHFVRLGAEDPEYRGKPVINTISYVEKYKNLIESVMQEHVEENIRLLREEEVAGQVKDLFEGYRPYVELPTTTKKINSELKKKGVSGIDSSFLFTLLYNFMEKIYVERYRRSVNSIVVEGEFRKKEMAADFSNSYYRLDDLYGRMQTMARDLEADSAMSIKIHSFLEGQLDNPIAIKKFENDLHSLDKMMGENARAIGGTLMKLYRLLEITLLDFKGLRVVELENAKMIGGVSNKSLVIAYDKLVHSLKKLESILERFMVTRDTVE